MLDERYIRDSLRRIRERNAKTFGSDAHQFLLNDPISGDAAAEFHGGDDELDAMMERFERHYWDPKLMNGAIPICHTGCALRIWLLVDSKLVTSGMTSAPNWAG